MILIYKSDENSSKDIVDVERLRQRCNKLTKIMKYDRKRKAVICFRKSLKVIIIFIGLNLSHACVRINFLFSFCKIL